MRTSFRRRTAAPLLAGALAALLLAALPLIAASGCGLLSSGETPLSGVYESDDFRVRQTDGTRVDVEDEGGRLGLTLTESGRIANGRLVLPARFVDGAERVVRFRGTYAREDGRVRFDLAGTVMDEDYLGTGTPLGDIEWVFYDEGDVRLVADTDGYVLFLERTGDAPGTAAADDAS